MNALGQNTNDGNISLLCWEWGYINGQYILVDPLSIHCKYVHS